MSVKNKLRDAHEINCTNGMLFKKKDGANQADKDTKNIFAYSVYTSKIIINKKDGANQADTSARHTLAYSMLIVWCIHFI
jgi:hypothetical protein